MIAVTSEESVETQPGEVHLFDGAALKHLRPGTLWLLLVQPTSSIAVKLDAALKTGDLRVADRALGRQRSLGRWLRRIVTKRLGHTNATSNSFEIHYGPHLIAHPCIDHGGDIFILPFAYNGERLDAHPWKVTALGSTVAHPLRLIVMANAPIYSAKERAISSLSFHTLKDRCSRTAPILKRPDKQVRWPLVELEPGMFVGGEVAKAALLMEWVKYRRGNANGKR
jgi:hypothetical protein